MGRKRKKPSYWYLRRRAYRTQLRQRLERAGIPWSPKYEEIILEPEEEAEILEALNIVYLAEVVDDINSGNVKAIYRSSDGTPYLIDRVDIKEDGFEIITKTKEKLSFNVPFTQKVEIIPEKR